MASFKPRPLYTRGKNISQYPLCWKMGGLQSRYGRFKEKNVVLLPGLEPRIWWLY